MIECNKSKYDFKYTEKIRNIFRFKTSKEIAFQEITMRIEKFGNEVCKRYLMHGIIRFWNILIDLLTLYPFDGQFVDETISKFFDEGAGLRYFMNFALSNGIHPKLIDFIIIYTKWGRKFAKRKIEEFRNSCNFECAFETIMSDILEIANIRFIELEGMKWPHCVLLLNEKCKTVPEPYMHVFYLVPEYFEVEDTFVGFIDALKMLKFPEDFKFVIDFSFLLNRKSESKSKVNDEVLKKFIEDLKTFDRKIEFVKYDECKKEGIVGNL